MCGNAISSMNPVSVASGRSAVGTSASQSHIAARLADLLRGRQRIPATRMRIAFEKFDHPVVRSGL
jgi:hypothetical protein